MDTQLPHTQSRHQSALPHILLYPDSMDLLASEPFSRPLWDHLMLKVSLFVNTLFLSAKLTQMDIYIAFKILAVNNLSLSSSPHHRRLTIVLRQHLRSPSFLSPPPVLVRIQVESVCCLDSCLVDVLCMRPLSDPVRRMAPDVDVLAVDIAIGGNVAVFGDLRTVPPPTAVAETLGNSRHAFNNLYSSDACRAVIFVVVLFVCVSECKLDTHSVSDCECSCSSNPFQESINNKQNLPQGNKQLQPPHHNQPHKYSSPQTQTGSSPPTPP